MKREGIRFRPPARTVPAEIDWLLGRALGPIDRSWDTSNLSRESITTLGVQLGLLNRIWLRIPRDRLGQEVGAELYVEMGRGAHGACALLMRHEEVCRQLTEVAVDLGVEVIYLKGMALHLAGRTELGSRWVGDVDVLVSKEQARPLHNHLQRLRWVVADMPAEEHHLPPVVHPSGSTVEIHHKIRGVRLNGHSSATAQECFDADLVDKVNLTGLEAFIPDRDLLEAHLVVHAIGQHGTSPSTYPVFQVLTDLQDLNPGGELGRLLTPLQSTWTEGEVSREEAGALETLLRRLQGGERASEIAANGDASALLLRHFVAGLLDADYRQGLRFTRALERGGDEGRVGLSARVLSNALWLTRGQVDLIYGKPRTYMGYWFWRAVRPFDLVRRLLVHGRTWRRVQRQDKSTLRRARDQNEGH